MCDHATTTPTIIINYRSFDSSSEALSSIRQVLNVSSPEKSLEIENFLLLQNASQNRDACTQLNPAETARMKFELAKYQAHNKWPCAFDRNRCSTHTDTHQTTQSIALELNEIKEIPELYQQLNAKERAYLNFWLGQYWLHGKNWSDYEKAADIFREIFKTTELFEGLEAHHQRKFCHRLSSLSESLYYHNKSIMTEADNRATALYFKTLDQAFIQKVDELLQSIGINLEPEEVEMGLLS